MTTLYVAGPMSGLPEFNYPAFHAAEDALRGAGYRVLSPAITIDPPAPEDARPWDWYMRRALRSLTYADGIALLPGWQDSRGAALEVHVGTALGMRLWAVVKWLERAADRDGADQ